MSRLAAWYTRWYALAVRKLIERARPSGAVPGHESEEAPGDDAALGARGEEMAYWYLRERGFTMVARNYRHAGVEGEVDLVGYDAGTLVFIEVKTRSSDEIRAAEAAVDGDKRRHLVAAAQDFRRRAGFRGHYRFDVLSVYPREGGPPAIEHFPDAFREAG